MKGKRVIDLGCGEGKNAAWLADRGCDVIAIDISALALRNAKAAWPKSPVKWKRCDVARVPLQLNTYDIVVAYGVAHCLPAAHLDFFFSSIQAATTRSGFNIVVAYNDRAQDLAAHPGFSPTLRSHGYFMDQYRGWQIEYATDEDLREVHPHNGVVHTHSMTRIVARAPR
jgi:cyclopropane fatty-acyl-phospholipid synthase-like methyltransferase